MLKVQSVIHFLMNTLKKENNNEKKTFPCQGTKISHATRHDQKKKKQLFV